MPIRDEQREGACREILRSAAAVLQCPVGSLTLRFAPGAGGPSVRVLLDQRPTHLAARGESESDALGVLLSRRVATASGASPSLAMTPELQRAIALLSLSRDELEAALGAEPDPHDA